MRFPVEVWTWRSLLCASCDFYKSADFLSRCLNASLGQQATDVRVSCGSMDMVFVVVCKLWLFQVSLFPISLSCELGLVDYRSSSSKWQLRPTCNWYDVPPVIFQFTTVSRQYELHLTVVIFLPWWSMQTQKHNVRSWLNYYVGLKWVYFVQSTAYEILFADCLLLNEFSITRFHAYSASD